MKIGYLTVQLSQLRLKVTLFLVQCGLFAVPRHLGAIQLEGIPNVGAGELLLQFPYASTSLHVRKTLGPNQRLT